MLLVSLLMISPVFASDSGEVSKSQSVLNQAWWASSQSPDSESLFFSTSGSGTGNLSLSGLNESGVSLMKKSPQKAFLQSMIFPGLGHFYGESKRSGTLFLTVEIALWTGMIMSRESHRIGKNNYINYAREHADVRGNQNHDFYVSVGKYLSVNDYNQAQLQSRSHDEQYLNIAQWWEWDNDTNRSEFKDMRIKSDRYKNNMYYIGGGMILNRIISAITASRSLTIKQNEITKGSKLSVGYDSRVNGPALVWTGNIGGK
jgi:hypothetical protein